MTNYKLVFLLLASLFVTSSALAADVPGSKDHPLLSRFPGSSIVLYDFKNYDEFYWYAKEKMSTEGKITRLAYKIPKDRSTLEVLRSYEQALKGGGFDVFYKCNDKQCQSINKYLKLPGERTIGNSERFYAEGRRALAAKRDGDYVFIFVYVSNTREIIARVSIVEGEAMEEGQIRIDAGVISKEIQKTGSIAVYDILFDINKAEIKSSSSSVLQEIARYLSNNSAVKLYVVGHTDNTGTYEHNLGLSKRRADAVVETLAKDHGISNSRLIPAGVGPVAPIASNDTEAGKAQNRRVQLVAQ